MSAVLASPVTFYVSVILAFGLLALIAGTLLNVRASLPPVLAGRGRSLLDRERDLAAGLGWRFRAWVTTRITLVALVVWMGWWSQIVLVVLLAVAAGILAPPWMVRSAAMGRQLKQDRALRDVLAQLEHQVTRAHVPVVQAIRSLATDPPDVLREILAPLGTSMDLRRALIAVASRSRSPQTERICLAMMEAFTRDPKTLIDSIGQVIVPGMEGDLRIDATIETLLKGQRINHYLMMGVIGFLFLYLDTVAVFHTFYVTAVGQIALAAAVIIMTGMIALMERIVRVPRRPRWDLRRAMELERELSDVA